MKTKLFIAIFAFAACTLCSFSEKSPVKSLKKKEVSIVGFNKLVINPDIQVVLFQSVDAGSLTITGEEKYIDGIAVSISKNTLTISAKKNPGKKIIIYVPVKELKYIELGAGAQVFTQGSLTCPAITVLVNEGSVVSIQNQGKVDVQSSGNCEFVYQINESKKLVYPGK